MLSAKNTIGIPSQLQAHNGQESDAFGHNDALHVILPDKSCLSVLQPVIRKSLAQLQLHVLVITYQLKTQPDLNLANSLL